MLNSELSPGAGKRKIVELMQSGQHAEALALLQQVYKAAPKNAEVRYLLGCNYARLGKWLEAIAVLQESVELRPDIALTRFALADAFRALGRLDEAAESLRVALQLDNSLTGAQVALAEIDISNEDYAAARTRLEKALAIDPMVSRAHLELGKLEVSRGGHLQAIEHYEKAIECNPESLDALCAIGSSLMNLARIQEAEGYYRKVLKIDPDSPGALAGLALVCEYEGRHDEAASLIEPLLEKGRRTVALALAFAGICRYTGRCAEALEYIDDVLKQSGLCRRTQATLHFAAGKILDRMERYDAAFSRYRAGNEMVTHLYDAVGNAQAVNDLINTFTRATFFRLPTASRMDERPIFVVGMPRSGTSLTEQILASHPAVYGAGELDTLTDIVHQMRYEFRGQRKFPHYVDQLNQEKVDQMADRYLQNLSKIAGQAERVIDKMPHNFYLLGMIQLLFPRARIIHCSRDPRDTGLSIYFQNFNDQHDYAKDLFYIGVHYHQYRKLMEHWRHVLSLPVLDIRYEELVGNQEAVTRQMLEFCELDWDDTCLHFHKLDRTVNTASNDQVRQPLYTKSVERWRNYESYIDELKDGLRRGM